MMGKSYDEVSKIYAALYKSGVHFKNFRTLECTSKLLGMPCHPLKACSSFWACKARNAVSVA